MPAPVEPTRPRHGLLRAAAAVLLVVALLAGCGGNDTGAQFSKDFKPVNDELLSLGAAVGQAVNTAGTTRDTVLAGEFGGFASRLRGIRARIDALKPPDNLKSQKQALSTAVRRLIGDLQAIATAARDHKPAGARAGAVALVRDSQAAGAARRQLARKTGAKVNP